MNNFTQPQVEKAIKDSSSIKEFLINLGLKPNGGQYRRAKTIALKFGLELPKYDTLASSRNALSTVKISNDDFFVFGVHRNGQRLKKRLIEDYGWEDRCMREGCPSPEPYWNGEKLVLQVDHIDGDNTNNIINNLRILCPNCHTQTDTYSNKKR